MEQWRREHIRGIEDWYERHKDELLSQEEVDQLPDGSKVEIVWSGGNGPHEYLIYVSDLGAFLCSSPLVMGSTRRKPVDSRHSQLCR